MPRKMNWSQARAKTDAGKTHDKINQSDPAAAPLGTDEEAGGAQTPAEDIAGSVAGREPAERKEKTTPADNDAADRKKP